MSVHEDERSRGKKRRRTRRGEDLSKYGAFSYQVERSGRDRGLDDLHLKTIPVS